MVYTRALRPPLMSFFDTTAAFDADFLIFFHGALRHTHARRYARRSAILLYTLWWAIVQHGRLRCFRAAAS